MDDYMFREYVKQAKTVAEETSFLEIFSYSVSSANPQSLLSTETNVKSPRTQL